jgi:hypothetical protein
MVDQKLKRRIIQLSADHDADDDMPVLRSLHCTHSNVVEPELKKCKKVEQKLNKKKSNVSESAY